MSILAQIGISQRSFFNGAGDAQGSIVFPSGSTLQIKMATPATPSGVASQIAGSDLAAGIYQITVVGVDPAGGLTLASSVATVTVAAGGLGKIVVSYVAPVGAVSTRVYTSLAGGATPDRYFTSTSATTYSLTTVTGATVAALPTAATAYRMSIGGATNWYGAQSLFPDGSTSAPSIAFASDTTLGFYRVAAGQIGVRTNAKTSLTITAFGLDVQPTALSGSLDITGFNLAQTWNTSGAPVGVKWTFTDTASAAGSLPFQILGGAAGATSLMSLGKGGGLTVGGLTVGAGGAFSIDTRGYLNASADGVWTFQKNAGTGFTTLNLGPTTGNSANGTLSISKVTVACVIGTDTNCTGKGTATITTSTGIPAGSLVLGVDARVITILSGDDGIATWTLGTAGDTDAWGAALALAATTTTGIANFTVTTPTYYTAATNITFSGTAGKHINTGAITVTIYYISLVPIGV